MKRLMRDRTAATAIEYGLIAALVALAAAAVLPDVSHQLQAKMVTAREGLKGKTCTGDPTDVGIQCR